MKAKTLQIPSRYNLKKKTIGNNFIKAPLLALLSGCKFQEVQFSTLTQKKSYKRALILIIANTIYRNFFFIGKYQFSFQQSLNTPQTTLFEGRDGVF